MKVLKTTSNHYSKYTKDREIISTSPIRGESFKGSHLYCFAEFLYNDEPNYSIIILKSDITNN